MKLPISIKMERYMEHNIWDHTIPYFHAQANFDNVPIALRVTTGYQIK